METVIILLFGLGCFVLGIYASTNFEKWLSKKVGPHAENNKDFQIKRLEEKLDTFIKQLSGE